MVFTAVLAAIAVIAAMVTVPGSKAGAAEPTDFTPNVEMGGRVNVGEDAQAWGSLTWAGPPKDGTKANPNNNVGWAWCIDPLDKYPNNKTSVLYSKDNATKLSIPSEYRDAVIRLALEWQKAIKAGDKAAAGTYVVYMIALVSERPDNRTAAAYTINGQQPKYNNPYDQVNFPTFNGSMKEFTDLTGLEIESAYTPGNKGPSFKKVSEIPEQPADYFVTVVIPVEKNGKRAPGMQRVMPPDQPGLPDEEGETEEPTTSPETPKTEENPSDETTPENPGEETTPNSETTTDSEPSNTEETTPKDSTTEPTSPDETTKVTEPTAPVPGTEEQEKDLNPKIETEASFDGDKQQVVAGATVKDKVHYEDLVPGKKYTLKAELRNKAADANGDHAILGTGSETFEATGESGDVEVKINVDDSVKNPVAAAVAYEKLYSHEVDENGKDVPNDSGDGNFIAKHEDIDDEAQTVNTKWNPEIHTQAKIKDGNRVEKGATVIDTVTYKDLVPGKKYTLKAKLISKADGKTVLGEGSAELVPEESAGEKEVEITVNEKADPAVDAAVAFEKLVSTEVDKDGNETTGSSDENEIATHENINDEKQTVNTKWTPSIQTKAEFDKATQVKAGVTVKDTVTYTDLVPGKEYTLKAELRNKAENDKGEHEVVGKGDVTFTPKKSSGEQVVDIKVNDDVEGVIKAAVAFEDLYSKQVDENGKDTPNSDEEKKITDHREIDDEAQTVTSKMEPSIGTKAEKAEGDEIKAGTVITDKVKYNDLVPGKEYTLNAELRSKVKDETTGDFPVIGHGEKTFVPKTSEGTVEVKITVDEGVTEAVDEAVAFEYLTSTAVNKDGEDSTTSEKNDIAEHTNIEDEAQTVKSDKPSETTTPETATSTEEVPDEPGHGGEGETSTPSSSEDSSTSTTSETSESEEPGDSESEKPSESEEPGDSESEKPSESEEPSESESSEPSESESVETTSSEASETSESDKPSDGESTTPDKPTEPSESTEPNEPGTPGDDEKDTPKVSTNADFEGGLREVVAGAKVVDQVSYEGLVPGKEYILDAQLISKEDGKTVLGETKGHKFTPESANGTEAVTITVNDDVTEPVEAAVAFETLTSTQVDKHGEDNPTDEDNPNPVGEHKDIDDEDQTVTSEGSEKTPKVSTNADFEGGLREVVAGAKVVDQVSYEGLVPGKEYILDAQLISKEDGKTVLGETKGHKFTPESANGTEAVTIVVDDSVTEPVEAAVAFETLTSTQVDKHGEENPTDEDNPNPVGEHKDINDDDQTVTSEDSEKTPKITTNADFEKGSHAVVAGAKIVDEVTYEGLVPGKEYTLKAELISKKDGKSVLGTGEKTFTPEKSKGMVPVTITVNDDVKEPVQAAVAFEELTSTEVNDKGEETPGTTPEKPNHIAEHKDINDEDQTVTSHEVHDQDKPGGSSDGSSNGSSNGSSDGSSNGSSKGKIPWWLILIPGIGLGKIIKDHHDHKDHGNHNGGHGDNTGNHDGGNGKHTDGHKGGNGHEVKGQDAPQGGNSDNGHGRGVEVQGQQPEETGNALPSNADRVEIKSVPSGATELEPGMQDYIK
ncbi:VaFE repeat-containing surface-anchored protein [Corynebacterium marquesiae]|uniref:VaFE repeat-containing surface-anchored protein n=1 Tax=Corynebacterium marquesiae TaxID=2913503 RepID=UPI0025501677|nr:VaFE repeat-containing surface-anchored protein [Corynebacterium marquesiae]MDK8495187.1 VaFE repeat-containing surface-anchored protein [Corynebacterium marquesiae]